MFGFLRDQLRTLTRLSPVMRRILATDLALATLFELVKVVPPLIFKLVIDALVTYETGMPVTIDFLLILVAGYFGSLAAMTVIEYIGLRTIIPNNTNATVEVLDASLRKLLALDLAYHERRNTGSSIGKLLKGSHSLMEALFNVSENLFPILMQTLITLVVLAFSSVAICLTYLVAIPLFLLLLVHDARKTQALREEYHEQFERYSGAITEMVGNIRTVKDFGNERREGEKASGMVRAYGRTMNTRTRIGLRNMLLEEGLINLARLVTLALSVWLMTEGSISAGTLVFVMTMTEKAYINLRRLGRVYFRMQDAEPAINRFKEIREEPIRMRERRKTKAAVRRGAIAFDRVAFTYPGGTERALRDVTFAIAPKSTVALVGRSGGGKTTVTRLLLRHFDADEGKILVDGVDVRAYAFEALRGAIAVVSQDVQLFDDTIANNIAYGRPDATREEIVAAARLAHADGFIRGFANGYETLVGERGVRLSGGQKQRVAIARAVLKRPRILVFDEATASLDAESERTIHEAIFALAGKMTIVIIAHRFATIERAERIILLEEGEVREIGTQAELLRKGGIFRKLRELQRLGDL